MKNNEKNSKKLRIAILANEPLGWGSGKHYFINILNKYSWFSKNIKYEFSAEYIYDKDILNGKLNINNYECLLVPGGGVGDGESIIKGIYRFGKTRKWKNQICNFIKKGGGYIGICGGAALLTNLITESNNKKTLIEKLYNNSSLEISCVSSYYKELVLPIFNLYQNTRPEKIGAMGYVFSFLPGDTYKGERIFSAGVPIDFNIKKDNPIFNDIVDDKVIMRWWGGPALILPKKSDRYLKILASYPKEELSDNKKTRIYAWKYVGGIKGLIKSFFKSLFYLKQEKIKLKNLPIYLFYFAGNWKKTSKVIELNFSNKACMTAEIYPNKNKGRIILCTTHPEYMIWYDGHIEESNNEFNCIASGFHKWRDIKYYSKNAELELTSNWWIVRRIVAWSCKVPDDCLPPKFNKEINDNYKKILKNEIFWDGNLDQQIKMI